MISDVLVNDAKKLTPWCSLFQEDNYVVYSIVSSIEQ